MSAIKNSGNGSEPAELTSTITLPPSRASTPPGSSPRPKPAKARADAAVAEQAGPAKIPSTTGSNTSVADPELELFRNARVTQAVQAAEAGRKLLETIPVRKPTKELWVRTHSDIHEYWYPAPVVELKETSETYFLTPAMHQALAEIGERSLSVKMLVLTCARNGVVTLWPLRTPDQDGRLDAWSESALNAAKKARERWVRVVSNKSLGAYEIMTREADGVEPKWPELSMPEIMRIAFRGKIIDSMDHPVIRELRGRPGAPQGRNILDELTRIV